MSEVGQMKWRTCFSSISKSGYKLDILKSALQKYLRRREVDKMLWCLSEIYLFKKYANSEAEKKACKGIITNVMNRLIIMMDEEMLFAEVDKYMQCMKWIKLFDEGNREDFKLLVKVCKTMVGARLLRLNSDIYSYWWRGAGVYKVVKIEETEIEDDVYEICNRLYSKEEEESEIWEKERTNVMRFISTFRKSDTSCYYWAHAMFNSDVKGKSRFRRKDCVYIIWEYLFEVIGSDERLKACLQMKLEQFFVKTRLEKHIWLSSAITIVMNRDKLNIKKEEWNIEVNDEEVEGLFENREKMKIDDYAIDMHCSEGRRMGKKKAEFAMVGCVVVNEDKEYYNEEWRNLYCDLKVNAEKYNTCIEKKSKKKVKNVVENNMNMEFITGSEIKENEIRICMEKTCGNKVMCFEYDGMIWKESRVSFDYNKDYELVDNCKMMFGLNKIGMKRIESNFRIEKINKKESTWTNNWHKVMMKENEKVVYCLMKKIGNGENISQYKNKKKLLLEKEVATEIAKIAMFRGIFRVTDFNMRNILLDNDNTLVSIDEGDIGKRKSIFGAREKWLKTYLNNEIMQDAYNDIIMKKEEKKSKIEIMMKKYDYNKDMINKVLLYFDNLENDLKKEGFM